MTRPTTFSLEHSPRRVSNRVVSLDDTSEWAKHLRRVGFREGVEVEVLSGRDPVMVRCQNSCVALRRCMLVACRSVPCRKRNAGCPPPRNER